MASSNAYSPLRLELRASRLSRVATAFIAALAALSLSLSGLSPPLAAAIGLTAALASWHPLRRPQPIRLRWQSDGGVWLDWPDGTETAVEALGARHLGSLAVLRLAEGRSVRRLVLWPDALSRPDRKALRRRLNGLSATAV